MSIRIAVAIIVLSAAAWAQHAGHEQAPSITRQTGQIPVGPKVNDAVKASQAAFRKLEKAVRSEDEAGLDHLAMLYEQSIDDLLQSAEAAGNDRSFAKDLDLAQRSLDRQLNQLQQLAAIAPASAADRFTQLTDAVTIGRDNILAQREELRVTESDSGAESHSSHTGHGCGGHSSRPFSF